MKVEFVGYYTNGREVSSFSMSYIEMTESLGKEVEYHVFDVDGERIITCGLVKEGSGEWAWSKAHEA